MSKNDDRMERDYYHFLHYEEIIQEMRWWQTAEENTQGEKK